MPPTTYPITAGIPQPATVELISGAPVIGEFVGKDARDLQAAIVSRCSTPADGDHNTVEAALGGEALKAAPMMAVCAWLIPRFSTSRVPLPPLQVTISRATGMDAEGTAMLDLLITPV